MLIRDVRTRNPVCIDRNATILIASNLMRVYAVADLVVTEEREGKLHPVGILSARMPSKINADLAKFAEPTIEELLALVRS
jgi:CBS domain-containing protein